MKFILHKFEKAICFQLLSTNSIETKLVMSKFGDGTCPTTVSIKGNAASTLFGKGVFLLKPLNVQLKYFTNNLQRDEYYDYIIETLKLYSSE